MKSLIAVLLIMTTTTVSAAELYDKETGKYLGQLGGSQYAPDSTNNPYGKYGSQYSPNSPNNPYATNPPVIIDTRK